MFGSFSSRVTRWVSIASVVAMSACGSHAGSLLPTTGDSQASALVPNAAPPACKGQKTTAKYAKDVTALSTKGGQLCIPAFGGFGGTIQYPSANPSVKMTLISSTDNYAKLPPLGSGSPIFYLQLAISGATSFGTNVAAGGGLASAKIIAGKPYTAFGAASAFGVTEDFTPCYAIATKGKYGGQIGGLGTLLKGVTVPVAAKGYIEIYPGKQASGKCG